MSAYLQRHLVTMVDANNMWRQKLFSEDAVLQDARAAHEAGSRYHVAFVHWGTELLSRPWPDQVSAAHRLIDSGLVQMIVGMHSHCVQTFEIYKGCHIFYGLGNCVFPNYLNMPSRFFNGVSTISWQEIWPDACNKSLAVLLDMPSERVEAVVCDYSAGSLQVVGNAVPAENVNVTKSDVDEAVRRRIKSGENLLMAGRGDLARWHFDAAIRSRTSYLKGIGGNK